MTVMNVTLFSTVSPHTHKYDYYKQSKNYSKQESVECNAMKEWKLSIFNIVDKRIKFYSQNTNLLPPKPKSSFRHLKQGIQEFRRKYVLAPADKAANNVVVVCRLHYINTLKQELNGTKAYKETSIDKKSVVYSHSNEIPKKFAEDVKEYNYRTFKIINLLSHCHQS